MPVSKTNSPGLSPPTRGNPGGNHAPHAGRRSIPAHAGEPARERHAVNRNRVYPRPRGGTAGKYPAPPNLGGLSPPTRGNQGRAGRRSVRAGSIPAHAGEPAFAIVSAVKFTVYPRPRGGTEGGETRGGRTRGLSPPTRGNRIARKPAPASRGSIPAHAGEPPRYRRTAGGAEVYPRPRGGTSPPLPQRFSFPGLSPPTRGNPPKSRSRIVRSRSIPAHAGEPSASER